MLGLAVGARLVVGRLVVAGARVWPRGGDTTRGRLGEDERPIDGRLLVEPLLPAAVLGRRWSTGRPMFPVMGGKLLVLGLAPVAGVVLVPCVVLEDGATLPCDGVVRRCVDGGGDTDALVGLRTAPGRAWAVGVARRSAGGVTVALRAGDSLYSTIRDGGALRRRTTGAQGCPARRVVNSKRGRALSGVAYTTRVPLYR